MKLIKRFVDAVKNKGFSAALNAVLSYIRYRFGDEYKINQRRKNISAEVSRMFCAAIAYGAFKGLKFPSENWWGMTDRASMILGLYEKEVLESLVTVPKKYSTFIDLGAADGYYAVGVLVGNIFERSYCFEMSEQSRSILGKNAELNGVSGRISIHGVADREFYKIIPVDRLAASVLLVDIEGAEFELFDADLFRSFKDSVIFIELHDWLFDDAQNKLVKLRADAAEFFDITELTTASRDLSKIPELKKFSDTDRWLICSEGRAKQMFWYRLDPKTAASIV